MDDLIIGGKDYAQLAERLEALLKRCRKAGMTLASNMVQVGSRVSFAGYVIDGTTQSHIIGFGSASCEYNLATYTI